MTPHPAEDGVLDAPSDLVRRNDAAQAPAIRLRHNRPARRSFSVADGVAVAARLPGYVAGAVTPPVGAYEADVVILALDRSGETEVAIASALAQQGVSRHIFVVDQGSHPESLARLARAVAGREDATLVSLRRNLGVAGGRNRGAALGHGNVIVGLDNDAAFGAADTLARAVAAFDDDPLLAATGFRILIDCSGEDDLSSWGYPRALLPRAGEAFAAVTFVGAGHAVRRTAWQAAGGYDEALFFSWEEFDFCLRAIELGWHVRYRGDIEVRHKVSPERRVCWAEGRWFHFVRNRLYVERKRGTSWVALTPRIGGYLLKGLRNRLPAETLRAIAAAARMSAGIRPRSLSPAARAYMARHDQAHRGSALRRLKGEVFARLAGAG